MKCFIKRNSLCRAAMLHSVKRLRMCERCNDLVACSWCAFRQWEPSCHTTCTIVWLVWQSSKQNGKSTSYSFLKNLCVQKLASFPFPDFFFLLRFLRTFQFSFVLFGETAVVSCVFLWNFSREVGTRLAETDPLAHARRLTVVYELTGCVLCVTCNLIYCDAANMITMFLNYS